MSGPRQTLGAYLTPEQRAAAVADLPDAIRRARVQASAHWHLRWAVAELTEARAGQPPEELARVLGRWTRTLLGLDVEQLEECAA